MKSCFFSDVVNSFPQAGQIAHKTPNSGEPRVLAFKLGSNCVILARIKSLVRIASPGEGRNLSTISVTKISANKSSAIKSLCPPSFSVCKIRIIATLGINLTTSAITSSPISGELVLGRFDFIEIISPSEIIVPLTSAIAPTSVSESPEPIVMPDGTST